MAAPDAALSPRKALLMDISTTLAGFAADIRGAVAGGFVAALIDRGPWWRRALNGTGSVLFSVAVTRGLLDLMHLPKSDDLVSMVAAVTALVGIIVTESLQRVVRRLLGRMERRADGAVDQAIDRLTHGEP